MPIDPRTVRPISISDSLRGAAQQYYYGPEAFPGDGSSLTLIDVNSSAQYFNFGLGGSWSGGGIPAGAKFYLLYEDADNHVRFEMTGSGYENRVTMYVRKAGVDTEVAGNSDIYSEGWITMSANGLLGQAAIWFNASNYGSGVELIYDYWSVHGYSTVGLRDFLTHGTKMGYDFSGTGMLATASGSWGQFYAGDFPTVIPDWIPAVDPDPLALGDPDGVSRWFYTGDGVKAQQPHYGMWQNVPVVLLKETNTPGGGTARVRATHYTDYFALVVRARSDTWNDVVNVNGSNGQEAIWYLVGPVGWSRWTPYGIQPHGGFPVQVTPQDGDLLEVISYDHLISSLDQVRGIARAPSSDADAVVALNNYFHPTPAPQNPYGAFTPWGTIVEVRVNGEQVYQTGGITGNAPESSVFEEQLDTGTLLGTCWGLYDDGAILGEAATYADFDFRPYAYSPVAVVIWSRMGLADDGISETWKFEAHRSQVLAPFVRSTNIVRYVFELVGGGWTQDGSATTATHLFDMTDYPYSTTQHFQVKVTVYNEEGLSDSTTIDVYIDKPLPPQTPDLNGKPGDDRTIFSPLDATVVG